MLASASNLKMQEKNLLFLLLAIIIFLLGFSLYVNVSGLLSPLENPVAGEGLGKLCSNEADCASFCQNNRGQCENYCNDNSENELCAVIFSLEDSGEGIKIEQQDCVSNPNPVFTHTFTDIDKLSEISRYGNNAFYNPGSQARSYVVVKENESTTVYAPTKVTVVRIYFSDKNYSQFFGREFVRPEYKIDFEVSCEVKPAYDHLVGLSEKLLPYAPQASAPGKNDGVVVSIPLQAGEVIGYTSGGFPGRAFDFYFTNHAREEEHINPSRWISDHSKYMDCPYDYFTDELKQRYIALIPERKGVSDCGPNYREVPNTLLGYWFQGNATENNGPRFSLSASKNFVEWTIILGNEAPIPYRDNDANRIDPETITEGKKVCYHDSDRSTYVYTKMLPNDKIALVSGIGACPTTFPEERAEVFER